MPERSMFALKPLDEQSKQNLISDMDIKFKGFIEKHFFSEVPQKLLLGIVWKELKNGNQVIEEFKKYIQKYKTELSDIDSEMFENGEIMIVEMLEVKK
jgi:hypothetical protein